MFAVIVANGELEPHTRLRQLWERADLRIAADGGARNARLSLERVPHTIIGDMDSLDDETRAWADGQHAEFIQHPVAKNETDLELALLLAQQRGARHITILGAFGGRADQSVANVMLLTRAPNVRIAAADSEMWVGTGSEEIQGTQGDTISLIPLSRRVEGIITTDLEYPLRAETLELGSTRGISNVMQRNQAKVEWSNGTLLLVHLFR